MSLELPAVAELEELSCWVALPPAPTFVACCREPAEACADWVVCALWIVDCDCPPAEPPPVCVSVTVWLVVLLFVAVAEALEELVWSALDEGGATSSAWASAGANAAQIKSSATQASETTTPRPQRSPMRPRSRTHASADRPRLAGLRSPQPGGSIYDASR
jgi:hypothetical protein